MQIRIATLTDLPLLASLFDQYRVFYEQPSDISAAKEFLQERLLNKESIIFIACDGEAIFGFTQLYPSFSSVGLSRIWILNDLYVAEHFRNRGIAAALIQQVIQFSKETGRKKVVLSTAFTNTVAQKLYEKLGFTKEDFYNYELTVNKQHPLK